MQNVSILHHLALHAHLSNSLLLCKRHHTIIVTAFEAEDLSNKMGENKNNETEEEMSQSRIFSSSIAIEAAADNESGEGAETGKVRKVTKEALFSTREQKRAECVRKCRAVAEELTKDNAIKEMNYLLEDKVKHFLIV